MDKLTSLHDMGKFARMCVELDLKKPLFSHIFIRGHMLFLEYEGCHSICFGCGKYDHKKELCRELLEVVSKPQQGTRDMENDAIPKGDRQETSSYTGLTHGSELLSVVDAPKSIVPEQPSASNSTQPATVNNNMSTNDSVKEDLQMGHWNIPKFFAREKKRVAVKSVRKEFESASQTRTKKKSKGKMSHASQTEG